MENHINIKETLKKMAAVVAEMVDLVYQGLMENDAHYLDRALNKEHIIDDFERDVINKIAGISKEAGKKAQKEPILLGQVA